MTLRLEIFPGDLDATVAFGLLTPAAATSWLP
jgi:hypothetical protein